VSTAVAASRASCAFVAGATGYTGSAVVRELAARQVDTVAHIRPDSRSLATWTASHVPKSQADSHHSIRVDLTPWTLEAMTTTLTAIAPTIVFALLGTTRARQHRAAREGRGGTPETYLAIDHDLTALLLQAAVAAGRVTSVWPRFVYLSAVGASPDSRLTYLAVRGRIEDALRASGLAYVIARPSIITGPDRNERRPGERAAALGIDAVLAIAAALGARRLQTKYESLTGRQLARALVALALDSGEPRIVVETGELRRVSDQLL
jgi:uncharacterized protein YbjT (DUF2867 family)